MTAAFLQISYSPTYYDQVCFFDLIFVKIQCKDVLEQRNFLKKNKKQQEKLFLPLGWRTVLSVWLFDFTIHSALFVFLYLYFAYAQKLQT